MPEKIYVPINVRSSTRSSLESDMLALSGEEFDISRDELARFNLLKLTDGTQVLLAVIHQLIFDTLSIPSFVQDLSKAYQSFASAGVPPSASPPSPIPGRSEPAPESLHYWSERVAGIRPEGMLLAATDYISAGASLAGGRYGRLLSPAAQEAVRSLRRGTHVGDDVTLLAAYLALLMRHGAGPDLVVGIPVSLRSAELSEVIGPFLGTVPLVERATPRTRFNELAESTAESLTGALEHHDVSREAMIRRFRPDGYDGQTPLFRHVFNFCPRVDGSLQHDGWARDVQQIHNGFSRYDLEFTLSPDGPDYHLQITYRRDLHDEGFVRRIFDKYEALLLSAARNPECEIGRLPITTEHEKVVELANRTAVRWPGPRTVAGLINARIHGAPDAVALASPSGKMSYGELGHLVRRVTARLLTSGVGTGDIVAVAADRSPVSVAAILAAWHVGAAYLPLDSAQPLDRLRYELRDAGTPALVARAGTLRRLSDSAGLLISVEELTAEKPGDYEGTDSGTASERDCEPDPDSIAYVIYTSGSTGKPKGVQVTHANLSNVVRHFSKTLNFDARHAMLWLTTLGFDISALELFMPLSCGGRVIIADDRAQIRPDVLLGIINKFNVDVIQATPTTWRMIVGLGQVDLTSRWLLCGGEPLSQALARQLVATGGRLTNVYGPSETCIWSTAEAIPQPAPGGNPGIGRPISNTVVAVIDEFGLDCPVDVVGEVVIGGAGVGAGYLRRDELTRARFIKHGRIGRAYRTGDLGRWCPDGRLVLHGRLDRQVKVHGGRVELDEVESVLEAHSNVETAAVIVHRAGETMEALAAFVVLKTDVTVEELRHFAGRQLPRFAVPSTITQLSVLPTNASGKIDYVRLAELASAPPRQAEPPGDRSWAHDDLIVWLVRLWRDSLDNPGLHADSNLFQSGGQSLIAISIIDHVRRRYEVDLPPLAIFDHPTPRGLAARVRAQR
jgi:amino acid adenylation domain-containing protein